MLKRFFLNSAVVAGTLVLLVAAAEAFVRMSYPAPDSYFKPDTKNQVFVSSSVPGLVYDLNPNATSTRKDIEFRINSSGFRDRDYSTDAKNRFRVMALGDSITFGYGLPVEDSYPKQLETYLRQSRMQVDVINAGVSGYSPTEEVAFLQAKGLQFKPDVVILQLCVNDITQNSGELLQINRQKMFDHSLVHSSKVLQILLQKWWETTVQNTASEEEFFKKRYSGIKLNSAEDKDLAALTTLLQKENLADTSPFSKNLQRNYPALFTSSFHLGVLEQALSELKKLSTDHNFKVVVLITPVLDTTHSAQWNSVYKVMAHLAQKFSFDVVNMEESFEKYGKNKLALNNYDLLHFNKEGHTLVADELFNYLSRSHLEVLKK